MRTFSGRRAWESGPYRQGDPGEFPGLFPGGCLELGDEFGRDPAAVFDVDSLGPGPFADFGGVRGPGGLMPGATGTGSGAAGGADVRGQRVAQLLGVAGT